MISPLQKEIFKGLKRLGMSQQYNVLGFIQNMPANTALQNKLRSLRPIFKDDALREIRLALVLGPEKIDF